MGFLKTLVLCVTIQYAVGSSITVSPNTNTTVATPSSSAKQTSSMATSTMTTSKTSIAVTSTSSIKPSPSTTTTTVSSTTIDPSECSKVNPACDKGKCCENSKVVKTRSITFTAKTCVDKKYVNQTACTKICDDKTCGAAGLALQIVTIIASFVMFWSTM